jgi:glycolate oxidase FAD binding subunit
LDKRPPYWQWQANFYDRQHENLLQYLDKKHGPTLVMIITTSPSATQLTKCLQKNHSVMRPLGNQRDYHCNMDPVLQHLTDRIRASSADKTPLRIRGAGSKDFLADQLQGEVLDMTALRGIVSYEPSELVVTVKAGTPLAELEAALAEQGQCLPFEPPRLSFSHHAAAVPTGTVGGMVAAGLSGSARASVGAVRDYVLGVQMLNGRAEHLTFGGQVMKNVAGYDMSRLVAGSWGMLGVITEVSLKVLPVAPAEATLCFAMPQAEALAQLNHWGGEPLPLNASAWVSQAEHYANQPMLFVRLRGAVAAVEAACKKMLQQHPGTRMDNAKAQADWTMCRDMQLPFFSPPPGQDACLWRISLPQTAPVLALPYPSLIEWHGAQRWLWAPYSDGESLREAVQQLGGSTTLFIAARAINHWAISRFDPLVPPLDRIHRQLKAEFDPAGIFNPGRLPWFA